MNDVERLAGAIGDRYTVEREIGRGGMATVYLARDRKHQRAVALKLLHPHLTANLGSERFLREVQIAASLQHPHIVPLFDSGQAEGLLYYVMPFLDGESLRHRIDRDRQIPVDESLQVARQVAMALDYAHRHQVVHRDIKPENIMLHDGEAMVADFGIAKAFTVAADDNLTLTGTSLGTPAYMSPEQAAGDAELDGRTDQYSLGCVLYEMLSGRPPFSGPNARSIIAKHVTAAVPPLRGTGQRVPPWVEQVVLRALAKSPDERYDSAAQFAQALGAGGTATPPGTATSISGVHTAGTSRSVAVLPFVNLSADPESEYFGDGIAEDITNALTKVQSLRVAARTSAFAYKGKKLDIRSIGEQLGVAAVLEGSVRMLGNRLRLTAQLVNVADGYHLWSARYDREMSDVFAIQDEIASSIVRALRVVLTEGEQQAIQSAPRGDVKAYDYYLRGRKHLHQARRAGLLLARRMFEKALEVDETFVLAHAGAAECSAFLYMYWDASRANLESAESYSRRAVELGPTVAVAHAARGLSLSLSRQYEEAEHELQTAVELDPQLFDAHYFFARAAMQQGHYADAVRHYEDAARVRPDDYQAGLVLESALRRIGRTAEAEASLRRSLGMAERLLEQNPEDGRALYLGAGALMQLGDRARAEEWAQRGLAQDPEDPVVLYNIACVYAVGRDAGRALSLLEKAVRNGFGHREWLEHDPVLDELHGEERFRQLVEQL